MRKTFLALAFCVSLLGFAQSSKTVEKETLPLIPYPTNVEMRDGQFKLSASTQLIVNDGGRFVNEVYYLQTLLKPALGKSLSNEKGANVIEINYSDKIENVEGYSMDITPSKITVAASTPQGMFYAMQTIRQLLPHSIELGKKIDSPIYFPAMNIIDQPAFVWRGTMLDVSRHMFTLEYVKKHIDRLSLYKMNKLHLHLTDDQGWRIEIKKYPKLTSEGGWRYFNNQDSICIKQAVNNPDYAIDPRFIHKKGNDEIYGGFFTQDQLRELVRYAETKHVELIPEIDMPGHMMAAISSYPYLTDSDNRGWGDLFSTPLCPCKEDVYTFVQDVLDEVADIFPSKYIHVGADEVDMKSWEESPLCKELMKKEGITDIKALQSHFIHRIQNYVESKGKKLLAWDEALEGGIDSNVDIMWWRGWKPNAPKEAAINGNYVVMSPNNPLYFDYFPNKSSLYNVYHMEIIPANVPADKRHMIKGAQANLWAETIPSENRSEYMMFPRVTALAERVWTNQELFTSYSNRVLEHFSRFDALKVNYRLPDIQGFAFESVFVDEAKLDIKSPLSTMKIHYTTDGSIPGASSPVLTTPLAINKPMNLKVALLSESGVRGEIYPINYRQTPMNKAVVKKGLKKGLTCDFYNKPMDKTTKIEGKPTKRFITKNLEVPEGAHVATFGLRFNGYMNVPETGIYSFFFNCDDGGILFIDNDVIVNNEGPHSAKEESGQAALEKGLHPLRLDFVEGGGGFTLKMQYSVNGSEVKDIPDSWFVH